jgi:hypothetical protein
MSYWNKDGLLKAREYEDDQNMLLRTAYYHYFGGKVPTSIWLTELGEMFVGGNWAQHPDAVQEQSRYITDKASHDEMTGIFYFCSLNNGAMDYYIKHTKCWKYLHQPQVFFFLIACKYKWAWAIWLAYLIMYIGNSKKEKAKNGKWDTDCALLSLLKIKTFQNLGISLSEKDRKIKWEIIGHWGDVTALIKEMLSSEPNHPLMELVK